MPCNTNQATADMILSILEDFRCVDFYVEAVRLGDDSIDMKGRYIMFEARFKGPDNYYFESGPVRIEATAFSGSLLAKTYVHELVVDRLGPEINKLRTIVVDHYMNCYIDNPQIFNYVQYKLGTSHAVKY